VVGSGGNLSARQPDSDECWVTASGTWLDRLARSSFVRVRLADGAVVNATAPLHGTELPPTSELALHLATYRARPDVNVIVHLHPQTVLLLDALGEPVRLATTDHAYYLRRVVTAPFRLPGTAELGEVAAVAAANGTNCVILSRHGCSILAETVELAHKRALYLEEAATMTYRALVLGRTLPECPAEMFSALGDFNSTV